MLRLVSRTPGALSRTAAFAPRAVAARGLAGKPIVDGATRRLASNPLC